MATSTNKKFETTIIPAVAYWTKLLGNPVPNYNKDGFEWSIDLMLEDAGKKAYRAFGLDVFYVKKGKKSEKAPEIFGKPMLKLTRKAKRADGTPANPVPVYGPDGKAWQGGLIGNGSKVNVSVTKRLTKKMGSPDRWKPVLLELQIWDHVPYEAPDGNRSGFPTKENHYTVQNDDMEWGESSSQPSDEDFDDEIPF